MKNKKNTQEKAIRMAETFERLAKDFPFDKFTDRKAAFEMLWKAVEAITKEEKEN